jgi:hypothetical protein
MHDTCYQNQLRRSVGVLALDRARARARPVSSESKIKIRIKSMKLGCFCAGLLSRGHVRSDSMCLLEQSARGLAWRMARFGGVSGERFRGISHLAFLIDH